jgi:hypothetical protein
MSNPLRIGFVVEGPTDFVVLESVVAKLLDGREYEPVAVARLNKREKSGASDFSIITGFGARGSLRMW